MSGKFLLFKILIIFIFSSTALSKEVISTGKALIEKNKIQRAKELAIEDALRNAVEKNLGMYLTSETILENGEIIQNQIIGKVQGYVRSYKVLKEEKDNEGYYTIELKADIDDNKIEDDLVATKLIMMRLREPKILVSIKGGNFLSSIAEAEINKVLKEKGLNVILKKEKEDNSEIIIKGELSVEIIDKDVLKTQLVSSRATLKTDVFEANTENIITTEIVTRSGLDISEDKAKEKAIINTSSEIAEILSKRIIEYSKEFINQGRKIKIIVKDVDFEKLTQFEENLRLLKGFKTLYRRNYKNNIAELDLTIKISGQELCEYISDKESIGFDVEIKDCGFNMVEIGFCN